MRAIRVRLGNISVACKICDRQMVAYATNCVGLKSKAELQNQFDESFRDGFISRKLRLSMSMSVSTLGGGDRWDSRVIVMNCVDKDDCLAAICQSVLGEYFFAVIGSQDDSKFWYSQIESVLASCGYANFNLLFDNATNGFFFSQGVQIWSANDCGIGERPLDEVMITGQEDMLFDMYEGFAMRASCDFSAKFIDADGSFEWIDLN